MRKNIKVGAVLGYISIIVTSLVSLIFTPILLNKLGTSEYGIYSLVSSVIAYFSIFDVGLSSTGVRFVAKNYKDKKKIEQINGLLLKIYSFISVATIFIGLLIYFNIENIFTSLTVLEISKFKISFLIMLFSVVISFPFSVYNSYILAHEEFTYNKIITLLHNVLKPLIMLPLLIFGYKSISMICVIALLNIGMYLANYFYAKYKLNFKANFKNDVKDNSLLMEIFQFSFFIFLSMVVDVVFKNTDQVILGIFSGTFAVSVYDVAMQIRHANTNFSTVISSMFLPKISKMIESENNNTKEISDIFIQVSRIQMFILLLILSGFIIFGISFINLWVGLKYIDAYYIVLICMVPNFVPLTQNIGISILQAMNKHSFRAIIFLIISILNLIISIPLSIKFQGIGAAIGTAIAIILGQIITMNIYYSKVIKLNIKKYWVNFLKIFLPVFIVSVIIRYIGISFESYFTLIIGIIIYSIIYCLYLYFVIMNNYEKNLIQKVLKKLLLIFHQNSSK